MTVSYVMNEAEILVVVDGRLFKNVRRRWASRQDQETFPL